MLSCRRLTLCSCRFCKVLDGAKTGLTVRADVFSRHKRQFHYAHPEWRAKIEDSEELEDNKPPLRRDRRLHRFIMDEIYAEAHAELERHLGVVEEQFGIGRDVMVDTDLTAPWLDAVKLAQKAAEKDQGSRQDDLNKIVEHVKAVREQWSTQRGPAKGGSRSVGKGTGNKSGSFTGQPITVRQDTLRDLSKKFASIADRDDILLSRPEILRLAASYAYLHDSEQPKRWTRFPWDVALRELSAIKVSALGPWKPVTIGFYERFQLKTAFFNRPQS
jgi:RNA-dependent RNA polymerase